MKRKVVKQGTSTLMVSVPSEWANKYGIGKGDDLEITEQGRNLIISTQKEFKDKMTEINIDNLQPMTMRAIAAVYKAGYDKLKITFTDPKRIIDVHNASRNEISGFEVIEQGKNHCIVKKVEEGLQEGFEPILRRTFLLMLTMAEDSLEAIKQGNIDDLQGLRMLEESNNRFTTYCRRTLSKKGYKEHNKIQFIYHIIEQLEPLADQYKYMFDYLLKPENRKFKLSKDSIEYYEQVNDMLRTYYELFYKFDKEKVVKIGKTRKHLTKDIGKLIESSSKKDAVVLHYLITINNILFELVEPYLSLVL